MTKTTYRIKSHDYTTDLGGKIQCPNPERCTTKSHWIWHEDFEYRTLAEAREFMTDEPAFKIFKVKILEEITEV